MQISDEMVEAFGFSFFPVNAVSKIEAEKEEIRSSLEAALSAAEPSVAVKAVAPVDIYKAAGTFIDNDTFDKDHVSAICRAIASALTAQVQDVAGAVEAIRKAGLKARDDLLERLADGGSVDNDLADYLERIVDACVHAAAPAKQDG